MKQENHDDEADDDRFLDRSRRSVSIDSLIKPAAIIAGDDLDAWRQRRFCNSAILRFDAVDDVQRILPIAHHDDAADRLAFAVPFGDTLADDRVRGSPRQDRGSGPECRYGRPPVCCSISATELM